MRMGLSEDIGYFGEYESFWGGWVFLLGRGLNFLGPSVREVIKIEWVLVWIGLETCFSWINLLLGRCLG